MTTAELLAYEARRSAAKGEPVSASAVRSGAEHELHLAISDECARRGWIALHGAMSRRTHRTKGEPDFIILADGGRVYHVECKTRTGKLSGEQQAMRAHYRKLQHEYLVVRSIEDFREMIAGEVSHGINHQDTKDTKE